MTTVSRKEKKKHKIKGASFRHLQLGLFIFSCFFFWRPDEAGGASRVWNVLKAEPNFTAGFTEFAAGPVNGKRFCQIIAIHSVAISPSGTFFCKKKKEKVMKSTRYQHDGHANNCRP